LVAEDGGRPAASAISAIGWRQVARGHGGLFYVGAVLFLNGMMLLGEVDARAVGLFNLFVGVLQVVVPTVLLAQAGGDPAKTLAAAGIYLFGFTPMWV